MRRHRISAGHAPRAKRQIQRPCSDCPVVHIENITQAAERLSAVLAQDRTQEPSQ